MFHQLFEGSAEAVFTFDSRREAAVARRRATSRRQPLMKKTKILVIEDEPEMRRNVIALLRYYDYETVAADNGRQGVEAARREKPDLILCDVKMPELDGYGVLQTLQTDDSLGRIPFIFLTAKGERDDLRSGMNLGADDYLTKPVGNAELVGAVEARLRRSEQQVTREFKPDFSSPQPLLALGLTPRAAEARDHP
jgi:DNA-binding response OmpR family regulator